MTFGVCKIVMAIGRGVAFALVVSLTVSPALAGLANPAEFGLTPVPQASAAVTCSNVAYERLCGTSEQWRAFAKDACHRFRDGFGGDAVQCFEANMAFSRSEESHPPPAGFWIELSDVSGAQLPGLIGFDEGLSHALPAGFDFINFQAVTGNVLITSISGSTIPEPSTWALMLLGFAGLGYVGFRRTRKVRVA